MDNDRGQIVLVKDLNDFNSNVVYSSSGPDNMTVSNGLLFFNANDGENGRELWATDGTTEGTRLVEDINPNGSSVSIDLLSSNGASRRYSNNSIDFNDRLYFAADDGQNGNELWVSDGTEAGTQLLADVAPGTYENYYGQTEPNSSDIEYFGTYNGKLYFSAFNDELWVTDGTEAGTQLVADIGANTSDSNPGFFAEFDGKLYFAADDGENGDELWVTDGTEAGTQLAVDVVPGSDDSSPLNLTEFNNKLYFVSGFTNELLVTDGTPGGTERVTDLNVDGGNGLAEFNGRLYFAANDGETGNELWSTDGTSEGTQLVADINPGSRSSPYGSFPYGSSPYGFTELNGKLYFAALTNETGYELWSTDGTSEGTALVEDLNPGDGFAFDRGYDSTTNSFAALDDELLFNGNNGETGEELYKLTFDGSVDPGETGNIEGTLGADTIEGTDSGERIKGLAGDDVINALGGNDLVFGDVGNDELNGGSGNDTIYGGSGNDTLAGGAGNNVLVGQEGNDSFVVTFDEGTDTIVDFDPASDSLILSGGLTFEDLSFNDDGILAGDETLATIEGVDTTQLVADTFV